MKFRHANIIFSSGASGQCNYQYSTTYRGYCYFGNTQLLSWNKAKSYCNQENAYLADIQSVAENTIVTNVFPPSFNLTWIGLNDIANERTWVWDLYNSSRAATYTNWASGEPNDSGGEDCVEILLRKGARPVGNAGEWNDISCTLRSVASVCKKGNMLCLTIRQFSSYANSHRMHCPQSFHNFTILQMAANKQPASTLLKITKTHDNSYGSSKCRPIYVGQKVYPQECRRARFIEKLGLGRWNFSDNV